MVALGDTVTSPQRDAITATPEHPLFVVDRGWTGIERLTVGDALATRAGPALVVQSVTSQHRPEGYLVYNLTVEGDHTYFVGKVNGGVWAHNTEPCLGEIRRYNEERIPGYDKHHLDPPLGRDAPEYETDIVADVRNDNAGGKIPGGLNFHTAKSGFQTSLKDYIKEVVGGISNWNALSHADRLVALRRYYGSLGIPFPK
jgi:hypothetical protein